MRVWLWQDKEYGDVGARRWLVEWWDVTPKARRRIEAAEARGDYDEYDFDRDLVCSKRAFPPRAKGLAIAYAKRVAGGELNAFGCAKVMQQIVSNDESPAGYGEWVEVGEAIDVP